jgi:hypothetical protein
VCVTRVETISRERERRCAYQERVEGATSKTLARWRLNTNRKIVGCHRTWAPTAAVSQRPWQRAMPMRALCLEPFLHPHHHPSPSHPMPQQPGCPTPPSLTPTHPRPHTQLRVATHTFNRSEKRFACSHPPFAPSPTRLLHRTRTQQRRASTSSPYISASQSSDSSHRSACKQTNMHACSGHICLPRFNKQTNVMVLHLLNF